MSNQNPIIEVKNLTKAFGSKKVLDNISFNIYENELLIIAGISGTGKSTLLKLISGLEFPDSGDIILKTNKMGMVFQSAALFDSLSVFDNVSFPITSTNKTYDLKDLKNRVYEKLKLVGLSGVEELMPDELSGGMKKRVSFARAVINDPKIILYDEPTSGLDPILSSIIMEYIFKLQRELNATSVLVTHHLKEIQMAKGRVILLYKGKLVWEGMTADFFSTNDEFAKQFRDASPKGPMLVVKD